MMNNNPYGGYAPAPAAGALGMAKGGFWVRFVAYIIDSILVGVVTSVLNAVLDPTIAAILGLVVSIAYLVVSSMQLNGATVGKMVMGLRVVDANGQMPSPVTFLLRYTVGYFISGIILAIGFIMVGFDANKQGLHDKLFKTYVVKK